MIPQPKGMRQMVLGGALLGLGAMTAFLSTALEFELERFDAAICVIGACLVLHGATQARRGRRQVRL